MTEWPDCESHDPFRVSVINVSQDDKLMKERFEKAATGNGAVSENTFLNIVLQNADPHFSAKLSAVEKNGYMSVSSNRMKFHHPLIMQHL